VGSRVGSQRACRVEEDGRAGRKPRSSAEQISQIEVGLKRGPQALGYETSLWTANWVGHVIEQESGVSNHAGTCVEDPAATRLELPATGGVTLERDEKAIERWQKERWPELKKAEKHSRILVFIDVSGLSERPHLCCTWAPRRPTPVLQYHFNWKTLSATAGEGDLSGISCVSG
jgi:hypothetical protein